MLSAKGLRIEGHALQTVEGEGAPHPASSHPEAEKEVIVDRHKTALMRYELSKPVKTLLEYGLLKSDTTFFDYAADKAVTCGGCKRWAIRLRAGIRRIGRMATSAKLTL